VMLFLTAGVAVPTPGAVGPFEWTYTYAVTAFYGAAQVPAVAAALVLHAVSIVPVSLVGVFFMGREGLTFGGLQRMRASAEADGSPSASPGAGGSTP
jgi:uncharacterized membrane protein YbhN (UPF0104 family)